MKKLWLGMTFITLVICLVACEPGSGPDQSSHARDLAQEQIQKALKDYLVEPSKSLDEVKKLHQFEYNVFSLPLEDSPAKYEGVLDELGKNRWDCFYMEKISSVDPKGKRTGKLLFFCKRTPETLLRYVPRTFLGR